MSVGRAPKVTLVYFDAGGGHRATMQALMSALRRLRPSWLVEPLNLQDLLDPLDPFRKLTGGRLQDRYNRVVERGWTLGAAAALKGLHGLIRLYHTRIVCQMCAHWQQSPADLIVSLIPNFNRQLAESVRQVLPGSAFVTVLTDLADFPPHFWLERESQYVVCGTETAARQALALGHDASAVFQVSGMILNPRFYEPLELDRRKARLDLGLDPEIPTALVQFGGQGSRAMLTIAARLQKARLPLQAIFICGHNRSVERALRAQKWKMRVVVEGFSSEIPRYMRICDFVIGKPGPASVSEALHMGLPLIVGCNQWTLPQERFNARWIEAGGLGLVVRNYRQVDEAVETLIADLPKFRGAASQTQNHAVFEVVECLTAIASRHAKPVEVDRRVSTGAF